MIYKVMLGGTCIASFKSLRSAKSAYELVDCALKLAKVDTSTFDFCLVLVKE